VANTDDEELIRAAALKTAQSILLAKRRAEDEFQKNSDLIRVTLSSIGDAVISTDADGNVIFMNSIAEKLTGWVQAEAAGHALPEVFCIVNERTRESVENPALRALREGVIVGLANHTILIAKDRTEWPIDDSAAPIRDAQDHTIGAVLIFRDISERKRQESLQAEATRRAILRADVSSALAASTETSVALNLCCEAIVRHLDMAFARIWTLNEADGVLALQASAGHYVHLDGAHSRIKVGDFKIGRIAASGQPHLTNDTYRDPNVSDREWARSEGMTAFAGYPLEIEGRVVGVMAMFARHPLTQNTIADLAPLALGIAQYVHRKQTEKLVADERDLYRVTLESIGDAVISTDTRGRVTNLNPVAQALTGWTHADAVGQSLDTVFHIVNESTRLPVENPATRALAEGAIVGLANHTILIAKNGSERAIDDSAAPIRSKDGEIIGCVLVFRDVTETRRAEAALRESDAFSRSVLEASPDCVKVLDADGRLIQMNSQGQCLMEVDDFSSIAGRKWWDLWPDDRKQDVLSAVANARSTGSGRFEGFCQTAKGTLKWWDVVVAPIRNDQGEAIRFVSVSRDMTERRQMVEALAENEERFRMLADNLSQFAWTADAQGWIFWYNKRWYDYTGTTFEQMQGWGWKAVHHPDHVDRVVERIQQSWDTGEPWEDTFPLRAKDGNYRWFLSRAIPIRDEQGKILRWFGTNTDITEQRELAEKLQLMAAELSEGDRQKNEFLAMLAHELRNPLAPIRNAVQIIRLSDGDAEQAALASELIERQVTQLVRLVDDLLDVNRISRGKLDLRLERVDVSSIIHQAVETSRPFIDASNHQLSVTLPSTPLILQADEVRIAQVVSNLINNACKYSDAAGRIQITVERHQDEAVIYVKDTGIGIPADMLPRVFDLFTQVDKSLDRAQGGLGIGLTLVQRIVDMHGGRVSVSSDGLGKGSEFVIRLPVLLDLANGSAKAAVAKVEKPAPRRILVVDDNRDSASSLAMLLKVVGNTTHTASDGEAALAAAEEFRPDLILLDIGLPKLNGYQVAKTIRAESWGNNIVLVALTGWGQEEDRAQSKTAGFDEHLVKPVNFDGLMTLLPKLPPVPAT